jgi:glycosyltransferase involved in cell wall biosynthesis
MSYGLPVIAYDCTAGPSDLINDEETGFLIGGEIKRHMLKN